MSLLNRRNVLALPLVLGACGFTPAYRAGGPAAGLMGRVRAADPSTKAAFDYVKRIEERLGLPVAPVYELAYTIAQRTEAVGVTAQNETTRYNRFGTLDFTLREIGTDQIVAKGQVEGFTSYGATGSTVALLAAEGDSQTRLMTILADQTVTRLIALLASA